MTDKAAQVLTQDDLLKAIKELDPNPPAAASAASTEPTVQTTPLAKAADTLGKGGSENLRRVLDVSETLRDFAKAIGDHVDAITSPMSKSFQAQAEFNLATVKLIGDLKKSIDANTEAIKAFGKQPTAGKTPGVTTTKADLLTKSLTDNSGALDPSRTRRMITLGLEKLAKSFPPNSPEAQEYIQAAIKFESTGGTQISDHHLAAAKQALMVKAA